MNDTDQKNLWLHFFRMMTRIRVFERAAFELYTGGKLPGFLHLSIGQEAVSVGACTALRGDDYMASTHRGHGDTIAKGVSVESAMAKLFGKVTGACRAKGGSMHIADFSQGILGANGIIAAGVPITVGAALSAKYRHTDQVALCFFGDGATGSGPLHEGMNMSMLWKLPMIFVRQNNRYAESTPMHEHTGIEDVAKWASGYGMPACRIDGNDVITVYETVLMAAERARGGNGPTFIDCETYRWYRQARTSVIRVRCVRRRRLTSGKRETHSPAIVSVSSKTVYPANPNSTRLKPRNRRAWMQLSPPPKPRPSRNYTRRLSISTSMKSWARWRCEEYARDYANDHNSARSGSKRRA